MKPLPILVAAIAYWLLGALWYSALFGEIWSKGLEAQGIKLTDPSGAQLGLKLALTFLANLAAAAAIGYLLNRIGPADILAGIAVGAIVGIGIAAAALAVAYTWESKPITVYVVDTAYHTLGCVLVAAILTKWR